MGDEVHVPTGIKYNYHNDKHEYYLDYLAARHDEHDYDEYLVATFLNYYEYHRARINHDDHGGRAINDDNPTTNHVGPIPVNVAADLINDDGTVNVPATDYDGRSRDHTTLATDNGERTDIGPAKA